MRSCWLDAVETHVMPSGAVWHVSPRHAVTGTRADGSRKVFLRSSRCVPCSRRVKTSRAVVMWLGAAVASFAVWLALVAVAV